MEFIPKTPASDLMDQSMRLHIYDEVAVRRQRKIWIWLIACCFGPIFLPIVGAVIWGLITEATPQTNPLRIAVVPLEIIIIVLLIVNNFKRKGGWKYRQWNMLDISPTGITRFKKDFPQEKLAFAKFEIDHLRITYSNASFNGNVKQVIWLKLKLMSGKTHVISLHDNLMDFGPGGFHGMLQRLIATCATLGYTVKTKRSIGDNPCLMRIFALILMLGFFWSISFAFGS